jgi:plasmid stability protein
LEARLKVEAARLHRPMADLIREAIRQKLDTSEPLRSPHGGAFASGRADIADRAEELLAMTRFGGA